MSTTVVGLVDTPRAAEGVVRELTSVCRCHPMDISQVTRDATDDAPMRGGGPGKATRGALGGAGIGIAIGGVAGLVASATALSLPIQGFNTVIAAGPVASALAGAGIGAMVFALLGALINLGGREEEANYFEAPRRARCART